MNLILCEPPYTYCACVALAFIRLLERGAHNATRRSSRSGNFVRRSASRKQASETQGQVLAEVPAGDRHGKGGCAEEPGHVKSSVAWEARAPLLTVWSRWQITSQICKRNTSQPPYLVRRGSSPPRNDTCWRTMILTCSIVARFFSSLNFGFAQIHVLNDAALLASRGPYSLKGQDHHDVASAN